MSHVATAWAIRQELPALQKLVLILLADRHNADTGVCFPSIKRVARDAGMSEKSVRRAVGELIDKKFISARQRKDGDTFLSNEYLFHFKTGGVLPQRQGGTPPQTIGVLPERPTNQVSKNQVIESKQAKPAPSQIELPKWLDKEIWAGHLEVRVSRRAPRTPRSLGGIIKQLELFRTEGLDANAILETSNRSGWVDVYRPKDRDAQPEVKPLTIAEKMRRDGF